MRGKSFIVPADVELVHSEDNDQYITDVIRNVTNSPFISLRESKMTNVWYHDKLDYLFRYTANGFVSIPGSKQNLIKNKLIDGSE